MRIVIDTNVVASGIFFGGKPKRLLELVVSESMEAFVSDEIITEYQETLDELCSRYPRKPHQLPLNKIVSSMNKIRPTSQIKICRDPDDDKFINCAIDARCIYIVSGDKDLLSVERYGNVKIITVSEFFENYIDSV